MKNFAITYPTWFKPDSWQTPRWKTAIGRTKLSHPMHLALKQSLIRTNSQILDFGCGRGGDIQRLNCIGDIRANGFDPYYAPSTNFVKPTEIVSLIYVLNVIEDEQERADVLKYCWGLTERLMIVAVRPRTPRESPEVITSTGTFQKYFSPPELHSYLVQVLGEVSASYPEPCIAFLWR
jgi:DNA phosphorothioation-associated putative methyltransferase